MNRFQKNGVIFACVISLIGLMSIDFINPSLPYIMQDFHASQADMKGVVISYLIILGISQLFYGPYADRHGRRKAILIAFVIGIVGVLFSAMSQNLWELYVGRCLTALGTAGCPVVARSMISDVCHDQVHLKKAFSLFAMSSQLSPAIAPIFGGTIQEYWGWHWVLFALALVNAIMFLVLVFTLPETYIKPTEVKTYLMQWMLYFTLFRLKRFMIFNLLSTLVLVFTVAFYSLSPFIFHALGYSALQNAGFYLFYAGGLMLGAFLLARVFHVYSSEKTYLSLIIAYPAVFVVFTVAFLWITPTWLIILFALITGFLCGVAAPLTLTLCLEGFSSNKGMASAVQGFVRIFLGSLLLLLLNGITLHSFATLSLIFLGVSVLMGVLYGFAAKSSV